jgi:hypothetical protein
MTQCLVTILELVDHGNKEKALQMLLKDKGIDFKAMLPPASSQSNPSVVPAAAPPSIASLPPAPIGLTSTKPAAQSAAKNASPSRTRYHSSHDGSI